MEIVRLGDIATIDISNVDKKTKLGESLVHLCNFVDIYHNWVIDDSNNKELMIASANKTQLERFSLSEGQVAITKDSETRDDIGISALIDSVPDDTVLGYHCALITPNAGILDGAYLNCIFQTSYAKKYFEFNASGSGQRFTLTAEVIRDFPVPLPSIEVQKEQSWIFTAIHRAIANNQSICSDLEAAAKLLYDYWFVQFDFPDGNGRPYKSSGGKMVWNEELKREIPEDWKVATIGSISDCLDSKRIPLSSDERQAMPGDIPYYGATGIMDYVSRPIFNGEYVLLAEDGSVMDSGGHPVLQRVSGECWINNHAHVLEPANGYSCKLLLMILQEIPVVSIKTGSIQMKINQDNLCNFKIAEAPLSIRVKLNEKLDLLDQYILHLTRENRQLVALRDFLLPLLMNGQATIGDDGK